MDKIRKSNRIWELDFIRGFAILMVVIDHAFFDFAYLFSGWRESGNAFLVFLNEIGTQYMCGEVREFWRPAFLFLFFSVSGICTAMSRNNILRALKLWTAACLISLITKLASVITGEDVFVLFGVIHCLAIINLIYALGEFAVSKILSFVSKKNGKEISVFLRYVIKSVLCLIVVIVCFVINNKYNVKVSEINDYSLWNNTDSDIAGMFVYQRKWQTADYFPIFPYIIFFFIGAALSVIYKNKKSLLPQLDGIWHNVFTVAGRHSLGIYVGGQVVVILVGLILSVIITGSLPI